MTFDFSVILQWLFGAAGITFLVQVLRAIPGFDPANIPSWVKPLIGPVLGVAASLLLPVIGFTPDFGPLINFLLGTAMGTSAAGFFDIGKGVGMLKDSSGKSKGAMAKLRGKA